MSIWLHAAIGLGCDANRSLQLCDACPLIWIKTAREAACWHAVLPTLSLPLEPQHVIRAKPNACSQWLAFAIQRARKPFRIGTRRAIEAHVADLEWNHLEADERAVIDPDRREVHQYEIITEFLVSGYPFVIVNEVAAAIENELAAMDFDPLT